MRVPPSARAAALALFLAGCTATPVATPTPSATPSPTATPVPSPTPPIAVGVPGAIEGHLAYPSEVIPPLHVYAIELAAPGRYRVVSTQQNQQVYLIANLPPGDYQVFATVYSLGATAFGGGYTKAVACGLRAGCTDHTPVTVSVKAATVSDKVDVTDWYAPPGTFPAIPAGREPFAAGDAVVVDNPYADEVNLRASGTTRGAIVGTAPNGQELTIVAGPTSNDGYDWYSVARGQGNAFVAGFALKKR